MNTLVLATGNAGKIRELSALLTSLQPDIHVLGLKDFPELGNIAETGSTFEENARIKACAVAKATGLVAIADDSGLVVPALHGAPGVHSARYSGPEATDQTNIDKLLLALRDVPQENRGCYFSCVMLARTPGGQELMGCGAWHGVVSASAAGHQGFGYDPVFFDPELGITAAQMDPAVKNARSHRGQALRNLLQGWPEFWTKASQEGEK